MGRKSVRKGKSDGKLTGRLAESSTQLLVSHRHQSGDIVRFPTHCPGMGIRLHRLSRSGMRTGRNKRQTEARGAVGGPAPRAGCPSVNCLERPRTRQLPGADRRQSFFGGVSRQSFFGGVDRTPEIPARHGAIWLPFHTGLRELRGRGQLALAKG